MVGRDATLLHDFGRSDWADLAFGGREVLLAQDGRLRGVSVTTDGRIGEILDVADLRESKFQAVELGPN